VAQERIILLNLVMMLTIRCTWNTHNDQSEVWLGDVGMIICKNLCTWSIQSSKSSSDSRESPGCGLRRERPSGPRNVLGTWTRVNCNLERETIQQLMLAEGAISGLANIPLIYFASTSMMRFQRPMRYNRRTPMVR
jgi:hypothetical protein